MRKHVVWITSLFICVAFWCRFSQAADGWQPMAETIRKSEKDPRQYQAIKLDNGMTVLLVSDKLAPKSLTSVALPIGSLDDPDNQLGLAHYLEHMVLMGSKRYPQPDNLAEFLKRHGGRHNASISGCWPKRPSSSSATSGSGRPERCHASRIACAAVPRHAASGSASSGCNSFSRRMEDA